MDKSYLKCLIFITDARVYKAFHERYSPLGTLVIAGDSAGGNLTLSTLLAARENNIPMPSCSFLFSGWFDLALKGRSLEKNKKIDPLLSPDHLPGTVSCYLGERVEPENPVVSPLYANLQGLPPLFLHVGTKEILLDDTLSLAKKAQEQGVKITLEVGEDMVHVYPVLFYKEKKSRDVLGKIADFIDSQKP